MNLFVEPFQTLYVVERIGSISVCISCIELLKRPKQLSNTGLLSWTLMRLRLPPRINTMKFVLDFFFSYPNVLFLVVIRLIAAVLLVMGILHGTGEVSLVGLVALLSLALMLRTPFGHDGADQMTLLTFTALTIVEVRPNSVIVQACLWFLALQACLAYMASGLAKVIAPEWRKGSALIGILSTATFGNEYLAYYLKLHPWLATVTAWLTILMETLFPLVLILPMYLVLFFIVSALIFHLSIAAIMGLSTFFWSFAATYPAILYCSYSLHHIL